MLGLYPFASEPFAAPDQAAPPSGVDGSFSGTVTQTLVAAGNSGTPTISGSASLTQSSTLVAAADSGLPTINASASLTQVQTLSAAANSGSTGGGATLGEIADAVWDERITQTTTARQIASAMADFLVSKGFLP